MVKRDKKWVLSRARNICETFGSLIRDVPVFTTAAIGLSLMLGAAVRPALCQDDDIFEIKGFETQIKRQFKLSSTDARLLHPLIKNENDGLALAYMRYSQDDGADFMSFWGEIRTSRREFESNVLASLTNRQKQALRTARTDIESRILDLWTQDYVTMLGDVLELDRIQMASVTRVLEEETTKRHQLIIREARTGASDDAEWRRLGKKREGRLRLIFDSEQLRTYQLMIGTERDLIAQECQSRAMASHGR